MSSSVENEHFQEESDPKQFDSKDHSNRSSGQEQQNRPQHHLYDETRDELNISAIDIPGVAQSFSSSTVDDMQAARGATDKIKSKKIKQKEKASKQSKQLQLMIDGFNKCKKINERLCDKNSNLKERLAKTESKTLSEVDTLLKESGLQMQFTTENGLSIKDDTFLKKISALEQQISPKLGENGELKKLSKNKGKVKQQAQELKQLMEGFHKCKVINEKLTKENDFIQNMLNSAQHNLVSSPTTPRVKNSSPERRSSGSSILEDLVATEESVDNPGEVTLALPTISERRNKNASASNPEGSNAPTKLRPPDMNYEGDTSKLPKMSKKEVENSSEGSIDRSYTSTRPPPPQMLGGNGQVDMVSFLLKKGSSQEQLRDENKALDGDESYASSKNSSKKTKQTKIGEKLQLLVNGLREHKVKNEKLQNDNYSLKKRELELERRTETLENENRNLKELEETVNSLESKNTQIMIENTVLWKDKEELESLHNKNSSKCQELEVELESKQQQLETLHKDKKEMDWNTESRMQVFENEFRVIQEESLNRAERVASQDKEIDDLRRQLEKETESKMKMKANLQLLHQSKRNEVERMQALLDESVLKSEAIDKELVAQTIEVTSLRVNLQKATEKHLLCDNELEKTREKHVALEGQIKQKDEEMESIVEQNESYQAMKDSFMEEYASQLESVEKTKNDALEKSESLLSESVLKVQTLEKAITSQKMQMAEEIQNCKEELDGRLQEYRDLEAAKKTEVTNLQSVIDLSTETIQSLEQNLAAKSSEVISLQSEIKQITCKMEYQMQENEEEVEKLKDGSLKQLDQISQHEDEIQNLRQQCDEEISKNDGLKKEIFSINFSFENSESERTRMEEDMAVLKKESLLSLKYLEDELEDTINKKDVVDKDLIAHKHKIANLELLMKQMKEEIGRRLQSLNEELKEVKVEAQNSSKQITQKDDEIQVLKKYNNEEMSRKEKEIMDITNNQKMLENKLSAQTLKLKNLEDSLNESDAIVQCLEQENNFIRKDGEAGVDALQNNLANIVKEKNKMEAELKSQLKSIEESKRISVEELKSLLVESNDANKTFEKLHSEIRQVTESMEEEIQSYKDELERAREENQIRGDRISQQDQTLKKLVKTIASYEEMNDSQKDEITSVKTELKVLFETNRKAESTIEVRDSTIESLNKECKTKKEELEEMRNKLADDARDKAVMGSLIDESKSTVIEMSREIERMKTQFQIYQVDLKEANNECQTWAVKVEKQHEALIKLMVTIMNLEKKNAVAGEASIVNDQNTSFTAKVEASNIALHSIETMLSEAEDTVARFVKENTTISEDYQAALKNLEGDLAEKMKDKDRTKEQLQHSKEENQALVDELALKDQTVKELMETNNVLKNDLEGAKQPELKSQLEFLQESKNVAVKDLEAIVLERNVSIEKLVKKMRSLEETISANKHRLEIREEELEGMHEENMSKANKLSQQERKLDQLLDENNIVAEENNLLKDKIDSMLNDMNDLKNIEKNAEADANRATLEELESIVKERNIIIDHLEKDLETRNITVANLQLEIRETTVRAQGQMQHCKRELEKNLEDNLDNVAHIERRDAEVQHLKMDLTEANKKIDFLTNEIEQLETKLCTVEDQSEDSSSVASQLGQENEQMREKHRQGILALQNEFSEKMKKTEEKLRDQLQTTEINNNSRIQGLKEKLEKSFETIATQEDALTAQNNSLSSLRSEMRQMRASLQEATDSRRRGDEGLRQELSVSLKRIADQEKDLDALMKDLTTSKGRNDALREQVAAMRQRLFKAEELASSTISMEVQIEDMKSNYYQLEEKSHITIENLECKLSDAISHRISLEKELKRNNDLLERVKNAMVKKSNVEYEFAEDDE